MKLLSLISERRQGTTLGVLHPDGCRVLEVQRLGRPDLASDLDALVADCDRMMPLLRGAVETADHRLWVDAAAVRLGPPLSRPGKIIAIGLNYRDHAEEQNLTPPRSPLVFAKFPSAIVGPDATVEIPPASDKIDHEVELAVVIGKRGRMIPAAEARAHVFGYTILNDVTARDLQKSDRQWVRAKSFDTFCPMGPLLVTVDELEFPPRRAISLRVNGVERQRSNTGNLIFDVPTLVSFLSEAFTLEPGDVISTGTPAGVGVFRDPPIFLQSADLMEAEIDGIGILRNPVGRPEVDVAQKHTV